jgi:hypothetical protein
MRTRSGPRAHSATDLHMSLATTTDTPRRARPRLRLLRNDCPRTGGPGMEPGDGMGPGSNMESGLGMETAVRSPSGQSPVGDMCSPEDIRSVLVAGADSHARSRMLAQLRDMLPDDTRFVEAGETWEVVARASDSRMVVLTGDLGDLTAPGLMRVLSRRHPLLPVVALRSAVGAASPCLDAASL